MNTLKSFSSFLDDTSSLKKIYLATRRDSGQKWLSYKGFAGNKFFVQITENNIDKININQSYPILNYHSTIINKLLDDKRIKDSHIYNHPKYILLSGSKKKFHELVGEDDHIPKTVFTHDDALKLNFPIICKPSTGHSGLGINIIKTESEFLKIDSNKYDIFSEFINKKEEVRMFCFNGDVIFWMKRTPLNDKAKSGKGKTGEEMEFAYKRMNTDSVPSEYRKVLNKYCNKFSDIPYICFDLMKDKENKVYVIESNAQPGLPFDSTVQLYKNIYRDFYQRDLNLTDLRLLKSYSDVLIKKTLSKDKKRFSI